MSVCVRLRQVKFPLPWVWSVTDPAASWSSTASVSSIKERPKPTSSKRPMTFPPSVFSSAPGVSIGFSMFGQQNVWQCLTWLCHLPKVTFVFCVSFQEFMTFTSALIVERSTQGSRASIKEQGKKAAFWIRMWWFWSQLLKGTYYAPLLYVSTVLKWNISKVFWWKKQRINVSKVLCNVSFLII